MKSTTSCPIRWIKYLAWVKATPDTQDRHELDYRDHLATCPTCRAVIAADAEGPANPDLTVEEIENA